MKLRDRLLGRASYANYNETAYSNAYYVTTADSRGRGREAAVSSLVRRARDVYDASGLVAACDMVRMSLFSEARFRFQSATDDHLFGNSDLALLEHPWPNATQGELLARMSQDETAAGNSYIRKAVPADGSDALLIQMRPECVIIVSQEFTDTQGRTYKRPVGYLEDLRPYGIDRDPQAFTTAEVAHYSPVPDPAAYFRGMSWLTPVLRDVGADLELTSYKTAHLANGAMPGVIVKYPQRLSPGTIDLLRERIQARYGGGNNAGKALILDQGADMMVAGSTLAQLESDLLTKAGERRVCAAAGPGLTVILGFEAGDYQAAVRRFADLWARPRWRQACAALEHLLPTSANVAPVRLWYDVAGIAALREGELQRGQTTLVKAQATAAFVMAGYTRESSSVVADSGDLTQLVPSPDAPPPGVSGRATETERFSAPGGPGGGALNNRGPQAGKPQNLPGVVRPALPSAFPFTPETTPAAPNGSARG